MVRSWSRRDRWEFSALAAAIAALHLVGFGSLILLIEPQLDAVVVAGRVVRVLEVDGEADRRFDEGPRRQEPRHARDDAGQHAARDASVAGEAEQVAGVVHELVHMGVAAEDRHRALFDPDEVDDQQRQEHRARQPQRGACHREVDGRAIVVVVCGSAISGSLSVFLSFAVRRVLSMWFLGRLWRWSACRRNPVLGMTKHRRLCQRSTPGWGFRRCFRA